MTRRLLFGFARIATLAAVARFAIAQDAKCYYPNGVEAPEKPCSSDSGGSACCPDKWTCLDNGLCRLDANNLWGAYSCTDKDWKSDKCPSNICTYNMQRPGGESIKQCSNHNNQWCCNADDQNVKCCDQWPVARPFYDLQDGTVYATIGVDEASSAPNLASITMLASGSGGGGNSPSSTPPASSPSQSSSNGDSSTGSSSGQASTKTPDPITSVGTSISSGTAGIQTITFTKLVTPASSTNTNSPSSTSSGSKKSNLGLIVGCAVGIPLALALLAILIWLLRKRRHNKTHPYSPPDSAGAYGTGHSPTLNGSSADFAGGAKLSKPQTYRHSEPPAGVAELPSQGVGPERPISTIKGKAELASGSGFAAGAVPHGPNQVGIGGGTGTGTGTGQGHAGTESWASAPPGYSPGAHQQAFQGGPVEADSTPVLPQSGFGGAGNAGVATEGGRYIPYRPPQQQQQGGLQNVPEMAELSTVKTPPA